MNSTKLLPTIRASAFLLAGGFFIGVAPGLAQDVQHLTVTTPGGFPGMPVMSGISASTNGLTVTWDGPSGYYQLYQKLGLTDKNWQAVGGRTLSRKTNITTLHAEAFFKVAGPSPRYAGSAACAECHENVHQSESLTRHAGAFTNPAFVASGGQTNKSCVPCHTVGYGLPTGFVGKNDPNTNPRLAGVQCESCHGPAANHAANDQDFTARPRVEIASQVCGGCHTGAHHPTFDEWQTTGHAKVSEENMNANTCGRCHIGSARLAMIKHETVPQNDRNIGIECVVCHDPHNNHVWTNVMTGNIYTNQLHHALSSTNDFFLTTSDNFTNKYNPNINICAQCHNHRGASWTSSSRPPHHSPQYNMLLGTVGVLPEGVRGGPAGHAGTYFLTNRSGQSFLVTNQCVSCHMQKEEYQHGPPEVAASTGHRFEVESYGSCAGCHGTGANAEGLVNLVHFIVSDEIQTIKGQLDEWATTKSPLALRNKYGAAAWEYTNPGDLTDVVAGPDATEQAQIPDNIKKARFNLYLVLYDGSYGTHNGPHAFTLLDTAKNWVQLELDK